MESLFGLIIGVFLVFLWTIHRESGEEKEEFDPCESCSRWWECNGVDQDECPLWESERV